MNFVQLRHLLVEAKRITKSNAFVVIGSLSILGYFEEHQILGPEIMMVSMDLDFYPELDPQSGFLVTEELGEGSHFEQIHGYHADPVSPKLPSFPDGWEERLIRLKPFSDIYVAFSEPHDTAVSKYLRGEDRDRRWCVAGLKAGILDINTLAKRFGMVSVVSQSELNMGRDRLREDLLSLKFAMPKDIYFEDVEEAVDVSFYISKDGTKAYLISEEDGLLQYQRYAMDANNQIAFNQSEFEDYIYSDLETFIAMKELFNLDTFNFK